MTSLPVLRHTWLEHHVIGVVCDSRGAEGAAGLEGARRRLAREGPLSDRIASEVARVHLDAGPLTGFSGDMREVLRAALIGACDGPVGRVREAEASLAVALDAAIPGYSEATGPDRQQRLAGVRAAALSLLNALTLDFGNRA